MEAKTRKSEMTNASIVDAALSVAAERGLPAVTMQSVADRLAISKSGVFSRVGSAQALQLAVVEEYGRRFVAEIFLPAMQLPRGLPRLERIMSAWFDRISGFVNIGASIYEAAAFTPSNEETELRQAIRRSVADWRSAVRRTLVQAVNEKQLKADTDLDLVVFEMHTILLGTMYDHAFLKDGKSMAHGALAFARLIDAHRTPPLN